MAAVPRPSDAPPSTTLRTAFFIAVVVVAAFVVLEYVFDWPIHFAR